MSAISTRPSTRRVAPPPIPPLESGDRLERHEYLRRYRAMDEEVKAERIEGIVYMASAAAGTVFHGRPHGQLVTWLGVYELMTPGVVMADNSTILLDLGNDLQPDACLFILPSHGGRVSFDENSYLIGAPELIVEVSASSVSRDLGPKFDVYRRNGVREYIVHRTYDRQIDWFTLENDQYIKQRPDANGVYRSRCFPGLWLAEQAALDLRLKEIYTTLMAGIATAEHAEFVQRLAAAVK